MNAVPALLALAASIPIGMRLGWAYAVFILSNLLPPLMVGGFMSTGRSHGNVVPALHLARRDDAPRHARSVVLIFAMLQGLIAVLFYTWRPAVLTSRTVALYTRRGQSRRTRDSNGAC